MAFSHLGRGGLALLAVVAAPAAFMCPVVAQQPTPEQIESIRQSCRSDFIAHCSGVQPGGREALQCLQENAARLSPACSGAIGAAAPRPEPSQPAAAAAPPPNQLSAVRQSCTLDDYLSHCSWIAPNSPELLLCLNANAAQLSPPCQTAVRAGTDSATPAAAAAPAAAAPPPAASVPPPPAAAAAPPAAPVPPAPTAAKRPNAKQISAIRAACRSDFIAHCSGVQPGTRDALLCLERNKAAVSRSCQGALAALGGGGAGADVGPEAEAPAAAPEPESLPVRNLGPRQEFGVLRACAGDTRSLCGGIPPGGGRIIRCLARNASQLSPQCRAAFAEMRR